MSKEGIPHITCEHLVKLRQGDKEHVIVDIREPLEFEAGHILGSVNVPRRELTTNISNLVPDKTHKVVVVAGTIEEGDIKNMHAELTELGYKAVEFLAGGFDKWCEIAPLEIEPDLIEQTPEEKGFVGDDTGDIDPEGDDNEPLM